VRARRLFAAILVTTLPVACTGDGVDPPSGPGPTSAGSAPPSVDTGDVAFEPGEFEYSWNDVDIRFSMDGNAGTIEIDNGSGRRLAAPGLYAILGDGTRRDATIDAAAPIPEGEQAAFDVTFPDGVDETTVGLVILLIGGNNWGALAPAPVNP
jgi:hypothetical protein